MRLALVYIDNIFYHTKKYFFLYPFTRTFDIFSFLSSSSCFIISSSHPSKVDLKQFDRPKILVLKCLVSSKTSFFAKLSAMVSTFFLSFWLVVGGFDFNLPWQQPDLKNQEGSSQNFWLVNCPVLLKRNFLVFAQNLGYFSHRLLIF